MTYLKKLLRTKSYINPTKQCQAGLSLRIRLSASSFLSKMFLLLILLSFLHQVCFVLLSLKPCRKLWMEEESHQKDICITG